jgi:DNA repair exonuclease SbcCD ATPase subunit
MDSRALDELQSLARRDEELSAAITRVQQQETAVAHIRARSEAIDGFLAAYAEQGSRLQADVADSEHSLAERRREVVELERDLGLARTEEERERLEKAIARGRDRVAAADSRLTRARSAQQKLEEAAAELPKELSRLEREANELRAGDASLPLVETGPGALSEWAFYAHSVLFLAVNQLVTERDQNIREANELASMLLGEETYGSTIAQALRRVELRSSLT